MSKMNDIFIGRNKELKRIEKRIEDTSINYALRIRGEGGVGKTWLFRRLEQLYEEKPNVLVVKIDYLEARFQSIPSVSRSLVNQIAPHRLLEFDQELAKFEQQIQYETVPGEIHSAENEFFNSIIPQLVNEVSQQQRILILLDTAEKLAPSLEYAHRLLSILSHFQNTVIIVAGRPVKFVDGIYALCPKIFKVGWRIPGIDDLSPFSPEETIQYLELGVSKDIDDDLCRKIYWLTGGRSILVAIASEWLKQNITLPEGVNLSVAQLKDLDPQKRKKLQRQFEFELVGKVRELRDPIDWAVLYLAYFNRRYAPKILELTLDQKDKTEIEAITKELRNLVFVRKAILAEQIVLHDEAQRLFQENVWPAVDPDGSLRCQLCRQVIDNYYLPRIQQLDRIAQKKLQKNLERRTAATVESKDSAVVSLTDPLIVPDEEWSKRELQLECLDYHFRLSLDDGWGYRDQLFREATQDRYSPFQIEAIQQAVESLIPTQRNTYHFQVHLAEIWLYQHEYHKAVEAARKALDDPKIDSSQEIRARFVLGDISQDMDEILFNYERALDLAIALQEQDLQIEAYNNLGLTYRRQGKWTKAEKAYKEALRLLDQQRSTPLYANVLNNLAFVHLLKGDLDDAATEAKRALNIRQSLADTRGMSYSYSTMGLIAAAEGDSESLRYHRLAVDLWNSIGGDKDNLALMQINVAEAERRTSSNFKKARDLIAPGLKSNSSRVQARAYQEAVEISLAEAVLWRHQERPASEIQEKFSEASEQAQEALKLAREIGDDNLIAKVLFQLALLTYLKERKRDEEYTAALDAILATHEYTLEKARLAELTGELVYEQKDKVLAFNHFIEALRLFALIRPQSFRRAFDRIQDIFWRLNQTEQTQVCQMIQSQLKDTKVNPLLNRVTKLCDSALLGRLK